MSTTSNGVTRESMRSVEASDASDTSMCLSGLAVIVQCHGVACALPTRFVSRLVLPEQVVTISGSSLVYVHGSSKPYIAWDLGERLGMARVDAAWVLLEVPHRNEVLPIALRTGPCCVVESLPPPIPLPAALFTQRPRAIAGVFATNEKHGDAVYGLVIDVEHLWSPSELVATSAVLGGRGS